MSTVELKAERARLKAQALREIEKCNAVARAERAAGGAPLPLLKLVEDAAGMLSIVEVEEQQ